MPEIAPGMLFPPSYFRDQYAPEQERRMEAEQARAEEELGWFDELPEAHETPATRSKGVNDE